VSREREGGRDGGEKWRAVTHKEGLYLHRWERMETHSLSSYPTHSRVFLAKSLSPLSLLCSSSPLSLSLSSLFPSFRPLLLLLSSVAAFCEKILFHTQMSILGKEGGKEAKERGREERRDKSR